MMKCWSAWRCFPDPRNHERFEAPAGSGVYEVRHTGTGATIAFGFSGNVADGLVAVLPKPISKLRAVLTGRRTIVHRSQDLEYRTCPTATLDEARSIVERLRGRREVYWRRSTAWA